MDNREPLAHDPMFEALRAEIGKLDTPRGVENELLAAFARQHPRKPWYRSLSVRAWTLGGSLSAAALAALLVVPLAMRAPHLPHGSARELLMAANDEGDPYIALDTLDRIESEPAPRVVATEVPRSSLVALGVPLTPENAGDAVRAEMLVAADGEPLALRLTAMR